MPRTGDAGLDLLVGGAPLSEYSVGGRTYVEMDLQHASSYDCEYEDETPHGLEKSTWPVTPFQVRATNSSAHEHYWAALELDGEFVDQRLVAPQSSVIFQGFQQQGKVKEFLFALPRNQRVSDGDEVAGTSRLNLLGSVALAFYPSQHQRDEQQYCPGKDQTFRQANKIEAKKVANARTQDGGKDTMTGTARAGRTVGPSDDGMASAGHKRVAIWSKGAKRHELSVHYRQRHVLVNLGAIKEKETVASEDQFNQLLVKTREALGCDWSAHADETVQAAAGYQLYRLPNPSACAVPTETLEQFLKFTRGETEVPSCAGARAADARALEQRLPSCRLLEVTDDANAVFSAAALALFGTEDLYFLLRAVCKHEARAHPERYADGFAHRLEQALGIDADCAILALANATGVHFLLHTVADNGMPLAFRPTEFAGGKSKGQPAFVLARLPGASRDDPPTHAAVVDGARADELQRRRDDDGAWLVLRHPGARSKKRARQEVEVLD